MSIARLIYVGDPMCSWCYGFGPQLAALRDALGHRADLQVILGGLRPYTSQPWDEKLRGYLREAWQNVAHASGQPFNFDLLEREDFVYDTEPACRAVVTAHAMRVEAALPMFLAIQEAFYRDNRDPVEPEVLGSIAEENGLEEAEFLTRFATEEMHTTTRAHFEASRRMGVQGFPTVLIEGEGQVGLLAHGYAQAEPMIEAANQFLATGSPSP